MTLVNDIVPAEMAARRAIDPSSAKPLLEVKELAVEFSSARGKVRAVDRVSWSVEPGQIVALVGESGCGKSVSALSILRLLSEPAGKIVGGQIIFDGRDLLQLSEREMQKLRGSALSMIFQEPMTSLNPVLTIGSQLMEPMRIHMRLTPDQARARALELLALVGIGDGERRLAQYPHHLSGGMRQRVMIAMGLACNAKLIIADEPTTALDVTIQAQILELMKGLSQKLGTSLVIITHNLGIVARYADVVHVMYAGRIVESGPAEELFRNARHPYTAGLLRSVPRLDEPRTSRLATIEGGPPDLTNPAPGCRFAARCSFRIAACDTDPAKTVIGPSHTAFCHRTSESLQLVPIPAVDEVANKIADKPAILSVRNLRKHFAVGGGMTAKAIEDVSFDVPQGMTVGLVGESGCGKTTIGRTVLQLAAATSGEIVFEGRDLTKVGGAELTKLRRRIQVVFQDPYSTLNPRMTIGQLLAEPLRVHKIVPSAKAARERVAELLTQVNLPVAMAERYAHQLSGGQRQRVGIARALAMEPSFIVLDEPVSALDVSIQGQIVNLLEDLQAKLGLTYLFIAHDLAVVRHVAHRVVVMYLGRIMEVADGDSLYETPLHPYTRALLDAAPVPDPEIERLRKPVPLGGEVPSVLSPPSGCVFHTRCPLADAKCRSVIPQLVHKKPGHAVACIKA